MRYRDSVLRHAERYGVKKTAAKFNEPDTTIYRWRKKWLVSNKDIYSLANGSRHPLSHSNIHTKEEVTLIKSPRRRNPNIDLQDLWLKVRDQGYTRAVPGLAKLLKCLECPTEQKTIPSPTCKKKPIYNPPPKLQAIAFKLVLRKCLLHVLARLCRNTMVSTSFTNTQLSILILDCVY